jgi:hypothetical protein
LKRIMSILRDSLKGKRVFPGFSFLLEFAGGHRT